MKTYVPMVALASLLLIEPAKAGAQTATEDFYREWVDYRNGEISLEFDQTPLQFALHAIQEKTGFQIVIPSPGQHGMVNLRLRRQPLEPAIRTLISSIGYQNFALVYDERGRPSRAVVLQPKPAPVKPAEESAKKESAGATLSAEEHEKLQKDLARWRELKEEERSRIENRLKELEPSEEREQLIKEYGKQLLGLAE